MTRRPLVSIGACLGFLAVADTTRFGLDGPAWIGWVGFLMAWSVPWLIGAWWRGRWENGGFPEKKVGVALLGGFGLIALLLVAFAGYQPSLIDVAPGGRSNTSPPTLYTAVVAVAPVGVLMLLARSLDRLGRRARCLWDRLGEAAVGVYLWHLSALALCAALLAVGLPAFERLTTAWWMSRPVWFAIVLGTTALLVGATASIRRKLTAGRSVTGGRSRSAAAGVATATIAAALVGVHGPVTPAWAALCTAMFVGARWLLAFPPLSAPFHAASPRGAQDTCAPDPRARVAPGRWVASRVGALGQDR